MAPRPPRSSPPGPPAGQCRPAARPAQRDGRRRGSREIPPSEPDTAPGNTQPWRFSHLTIPLGRPVSEHGTAALSEDPIRALRRELGAPLGTPGTPCAAAWCAAQSGRTARGPRVSVLRYAAEQQRHDHAGPPMRIPQQLPRRQGLRRSRAQRRRTAYQRGMRRRQPRRPQRRSKPRPATACGDDVADRAPTRTSSERFASFVSAGQTQRFAGPGDWLFRRPEFPAVISVRRRPVR